MGHWLRNPRTTQERRANGRRGHVWIEGYRVPLRAKRNSYRLPQAWDDIIRGDLRHKKCWKLRRKTQYKPL